MQDETINDTIIRIWRINEATMYRLALPEVQTFLMRTLPLSDSYDSLINDMYVLPLADFTVFNETYGTQDHDSCYTCSGCGGFITTEWQGDGAMGGLVDFFESCAECIGDEKCPGCMQPLSLSFDLSAFERTVIHVAAQPQRYLFAYDTNTFSYEEALSTMPFEGFTCLCCGWTYDPDRHADQYDEPYDNGDYDYPALDASDYFSF